MCFTTLKTGGFSTKIHATCDALAEKDTLKKNTEQNHKTELAEEFIYDHGLKKYTSSGKNGELVIDIKKMPKKLLEKLAAENQPTSHSDRAAAAKNTNQPTR